MGVDVSRQIAMVEVVLDKSFLDGASYQRVADVCASHIALCSETLFFELMTTDLRSQARCVSKLPDQPNTFALIPNVGTLLRFESENRLPCTPLFDRRIEGSYVFNPKLRDGSYVPVGEVLDTLNNWRAEVIEDTKAFLQRCQSVHEFFPELIGIEFRDFPTAVAAARLKVVTDEDFVRRLYASFLTRGAVPSAPDPAIVSPQWAWFRWVQCQIMAALRIFQRYQCRVPDPPSRKVLLKAEHSMHDLSYILLGSLAGAIATDDTEVKEDFKLVCPEGQLIPLRTT